MPLARIIASNPAAARDTAKALREAGYKVEIVPPGTAVAHAADLEFDADTDTVISQSTEAYTPGEREFVLAPLWRRLTSRFHSARDVARAQHQMSGNSTRALSTPPTSAAAPTAPERNSDEAAHQAAAMAEEHQHERLRHEQQALRQREMEAQRAFALQQEETRKRQELSRQRELEQQQMALRRQEEVLREHEELRRQEEAAAAQQVQLARAREEGHRQEALRRNQEEEHRREILRSRHEEELSRRAEAQILLLEANKRREESIRQRELEAASANVVVESAAASTLPPLSEYMKLRLAQWRRGRTAKLKITHIDQAGAFAWRQAWPITAGVAAAFLLGWGIAAYEGSPTKAARQTPPPMIAPGQYSPYPIAKVPAIRPSRGGTSPHAYPVKRKTVRDGNIGQDEVIVKHYYQQKATTAQSGTPQRPKKISDLQ